MPNISCADNANQYQNHPWVTKNGNDPLLSEAENCADMVETPNELEVNHAFTRKMDHLICVVSSPSINSTVYVAKNKGSR